MSKPSFIYVTYIESTPEKVWQALTDSAFTRRYWVNHRNASDWKVGSPWRHEDFDDASLVDIVGHVVEISPPRHLVLTWAFPKDVKDPDKVSRVTFDIETYGDGVRLTVTHSDLEPELRDATGDHEGLAARAVQPKDSARDRKAATRNLYAHDQAAGVMGRHFNCAQGWSREGQAETDTILAPACLSHRGPCRLCHDPKPPQTSCRPRP